MESEKYDLSLVIACYNEKRVFHRSLQEIQSVLNTTRYRYEIIFVDDGSSDGTRELIKDAAINNPDIRYLFHEQNTGRGKTVADGIEIARGDVAGFVDFDLATSAWYIPRLISRVFEEADVAMAWRVYKIRPAIMHRWILSRGYHFLMNYLLGVPLKDTETGFKFFKRTKVLPILRETCDPHWFWDTEICTRCYFAGLNIVEVPTLYIRRPETGTTVKIFRDSWYYLIHLLRFRNEAKRLCAARSCGK